MTTIAEAPSLPEHLDPGASAGFGAALGDAHAVRELRRAAAKATLGLSPPTRADRPWRYTDFDALALAARRVLPPEGNRGEVPRGPAFELSDGTVTGVAPLGPTTVDLLDRNTQLLARAGLVGRAIEPRTDLVSALHYAFVETPVVVDVPDDIETPESVRVVRRFSRPDQLSAPHTLIVTGRNARVSVIEEFHSTDAAMTVLPAVEILPGPGAEVRYTALHRWGASTAVFTNQKTVTAPDSGIVSLAVVTGGATVKSHTTAALEGRGSSSEIFGLFAGAGSQHFDLYTIQDHIAADTRSDLLYKAALRDRSSSAYYGLTRVGLGARNADASQENKNLLLSTDARADSDPVLEILTSDVIRAAHGATAGPVDERQLFYLEARGIPRHEAEELLVTGFLGEVLDRIPDLELRAEIAASVGLRDEELL